MLFFREVCQERPDFRFSHFLRVAFLMEEDKLQDPVDIRFVGSGAKVADGHCRPYLVEQFWSGHLICSLSGGYGALNCTPGVYPRRIQFSSKYITVSSDFLRHRYLSKYS